MQANSFPATWKREIAPFTLPITPAHHAPSRLILFLSHTAGPFEALGGAHDPARLPFLTLGCPK